MALIGHGVGLRPAHYPQIVGPLERGVRLRTLGLEWFEVISENFLEPGGNPRRVLRTVRESFPIALHGVSLSLGSMDPLNEQYLAKLAELIHEIEPALISDHLCWGSVDGSYAHDLLPLPFTEEALQHVTQRVLAVQARLRRAIAIENVSSYLQFRHSTMPEWEFLGALVERTHCKLLLDVNNVFVSAHNHGFDPQLFISSLPQGCVVQMHLAGHSQQGSLRLDTHDNPVCKEVWELYRFAVAAHGAAPTCIEWDDDIPSFDRLLAESAQAAEVSAQVQPKHVAHD